MVVTLLLASLPVAAPPVAVAVDAGARAGLERHAVHATAHGKSLDCEGVLLAELLRRANVLPANKLAGASLDHYLVVEARDGYRVSYALAEIDPGTGNHPVCLVDHCAGAPIDDDDGPLRLIAPDGERPARWVRQVERITVHDPE